MALHAELVHVELVHVELVHGAVASHAVVHALAQQVLCGHGVVHAS